MVKKTDFSISSINLQEKTDGFEYQAHQMFDTERYLCLQNKSHSVVLIPKPLNEHKIIFMELLFMLEAQIMQP